MASRTTEGKNFAAIHQNKQSLVVCPGIIYGLGEEYILKLQQLFLKVWKGEELKAAGDNVIPTIHVKDLAKMIGKIVNEKIDINETPYFLAVDKGGYEQTQAKIIQNVARLFEKELEVEQIDEDEQLSTSIKVTLSPKLDALMTDPDWHCKEGLAVNIGKVFDEFKVVKGLRSLRVLFIGPPLSGKSKFSALYNLY